MLQRLIAMLIGLAAFGSLARAHDPGLSSVTLTLDRAVRSASFVLIVNDADLPQHRRARSGQCAAADVVAVRMLGAAQRVAGACQPHDASHTRFIGTLPLPAAGTLEASVPLLAELPRGHHCYARLFDSQGALLAQQLLLRPGDVLHAELRARAAARAADFFKLGIEHIVTGYDHLLFLTVLLLGVHGFRHMAWVVSGFTLAHSLSLALATLGVVQLPSRWVELAIALSIVFVAVRNCGSRRSVPERLGMTFSFGLVHGLGFASALRELGVSGANLSVVQPLLLFNLGVEVGQLAIGTLALPLLLYLQRSPARTRGPRPTGPSRVTRVVSGFAAVVATIWLSQR